MLFKMRNRISTKPLFASNSNSYQHWQAYFGRSYAVTLAVAMFALLLQIVGMGIRLHSLSKSPGIDGSPGISWLLLAIALFLFINIIGIGFRDGLGIMISMFSLMAAGVVYFWWFVTGKSYRQLYAGNPFYQSHPEAMLPQPLGLVEAVWWNVVVLVLVLILFIWETRIIVRGLTERGSRTLVDR